MQVPKNRKNQSSLKCLGAIIIIAAIGVPWAINSCKNNNNPTLAGLISHFARAGTYDLTSDKAKDFINVLKGYYQGAVKVDGKFKPELVEFASRIYMNPKLPVKGTFESSFTIPSDFTTMEVDAPFHFLITGKTKQTYYFHPKKMYCYTQFEQSWKNGEKVSPATKLFWLKVPCVYLARFNHGKYFPKKMKQKIAMYQVSPSKQTVHVLTNLKMDGGKFLAQVSRMVVAAGEDDWDQYVLKKVDTSVVVKMPPGSKEDKLKADMDMLGFPNVKLVN